MKAFPTLLIVAGILFVHDSAFAMGGTGATCNPSTPNWGSCTLAPVPFAASVTKTINVPGGHWKAPYEATQNNTHYILQGDVSADSVGFLVKASYVIIDLNGYTITYNQISPGEGVAMGAYNKTYVAVRNGSLIQGAAMSEGSQYGLGNNPVGIWNSKSDWKFSANNPHIANLYVKYGGRDVGGIAWSGNNGLFEQNTVEDTYEFGTLKNRMQGSGAISGAKAADTNRNIFRYNTIINTRKNGISPGNNSEVYGNHITIRSISTNSVGIGYYAGQNVKVHDNTIIGTGEHPIGIMTGGGDGANNWEIYNNLITVETTALGEEYGKKFLADKTKIYETNSAAGIRVTWGGDNIHFYNNEITIVTGYGKVGVYSPTGEPAFLDAGGKGMFIGAYAGESSTYENNKISVTGDGTYTYGVTCSHSFSDGMFVLNNTITSSQYNIVIGDNYGACNNYPLFQGNILIKSGSNPKYQTIANTYNSTDGNAQARFVDNIYQNGASQETIALRPQEKGVTDVYFGSVIKNTQRYDYRLHDNTGQSTTLLREDFSPPITLNYAKPILGVEKPQDAPKIIRITSTEPLLPESPWLLTHLSTVLR